jgi:hypothetical protein
MPKRFAPLSESWLSGFPDHTDVAEPVMVAQKVLAGWSEDRCRGAWTDIQQAVNEYREDLFLKGKTPRGDTWRWYNADALIPGKPLANPSDFFGLLLDGIAVEHGSLRPVLDDYGVRAVLAITVLAIAADLPGDDPHDLDHANWLGAAVVSCWRASSYLFLAVAGPSDSIDQIVQAHVKRDRSERGKAAARKRHSARDEVHAEAMRIYAEMDPALPMAEAARRIQRELVPFAEKAGYRTTHQNPSATIYKWIRAERKKRRKA